MRQFKYQLEVYKGQTSRHTCPNCNKKKSFARYIDNDGNYLGDDTGRCNSESRCGYHKKPENNDIVTTNFQYVPPITTYLKESDVYKDQFNDNLYKYLITKFNKDKVESVFKKYLVKSTDKKWRNSTVFYQKDKDNRFRTGKIIQYGSNGKRVKEPYSRIYWSHNYLDNFVLEQCLFGEHLLDGFDRNKGTIYLVESEKTCIVASLFFKDDLFIATGGLSNLSPLKLSVLRGLGVDAIPDKGGYDLWKDKLEPMGISVNRIMEDCQTSEDGDDIGDLILRNK
tara:strand:- start:60 stop:905 length:846 start_codon:yes stop_codon:yes gene_type:complete